MRSQVSSYDQVLIKNDPDSLVSYKGPITPDIIATISRELKEQASDVGQACSRLFSIFIELAQNMQYYSDEIIHYAKVKEKIGWIQIFEKEDCYEVNCGNALKKELVKQLLAHCEIVNHLNREDLRKLKRERRREVLDKSKKGAGLGLIQIAILAGNPLEVKALHFGKQRSCIILKITINK